MIYHGFLFQLQNPFKSHFHIIIFACSRSASVGGNSLYNTLQHVKDEAFVSETQIKFRFFSAKPVALLLVHPRTLSLHKKCQ